jgi:hypothetical protein
MKLILDQNMYLIFLMTFQNGNKYFGALHLKKTKCTEMATNILRLCRNWYSILERKFKVLSTAIFVEMMYPSEKQGAAHRNICCTGITGYVRKVQRSIIFVGVNHQRKARCIAPQYL